MGGVWYLDSGASLHMTGNKYLSSDFEEKYLKQSIEFGDDERYSATRISTVTFRRDSGCPFRIIDVMYVLGIKKNRVSITVLEYRSYDVIFSKGKVFLRHIATEEVKQINVRVNNMYSLEVQDACKALRSKLRVRDDGWEGE